MNTHLKTSLLIAFAVGISVGITSFIPNSISQIGLTLNTLEPESISSTEDIKALKLMAQQCFTCHNPDMTGGKENRLAPPMHKVREHYLKTETTKEVFIKDVVTFVKNPQEEKSKMKGAIRNFGLMPAIYVDTKDAQMIAAYLYKNDLASDEWMKKWEAFKIR
ncbi:c-type cytochrome [Mongoliitalea daihaiensis]|uniref:c-type cytochrome n=1 Tax=Mongoliitalea daihaiensis TaxID=2782006 RepID=UPI001F1D38B1|nr:c-type cytochrome [Mongoliitalea daihaiensis]UJP63750.1 hypothetical protein IPZ59_13030 [Mongoliitalea daihaiensis]